MPVQTRQSTRIPKGYRFLNNKIFVADTTWQLTEKYLDEIMDRDPEGTGIVRLNDYHGYELMYIIDRQLIAIHTKIAKKSWDDVYARLFALTLFMTFEDHFLDCEDGEHALLTDKVYGACLVTLFHTLEAERRLDPAHFPDLECFLRLAVRWGRLQHGSSCQLSRYWKTCQAIGQNVFGDIWEDTKALHRQRLRDWADNLPSETERFMLEAEEDDDAMELDGLGPWFADGPDDDDLPEDEASVNDKKNYIVSRVWKEYKTILG